MASRILDFDRQSDAQAYAAGRGDLSQMAYGQALGDMFADDNQQMANTLEDVAANNHSEGDLGNLEEHMEDAAPAAPYAHLPDPPNVAPGNDFSASQKKAIYGTNMARNGGVLRSDEDGEILVMPQKSQRGVTPPPNEANIDHNIPKKPANPTVTPGDNSFGNARVLSRKRNRIKSNN